MVGDKWKKAKKALQLGCIRASPTLEDDEEEAIENTPSGSTNGRNPDTEVCGHGGRNGGDSITPHNSATESGGVDHSMSSMTPSRRSGNAGGELLNGTSSSVSETTCTICLSTMIRGNGSAIFVAECSHSFHNQCIKRYMKLGVHICPNCRAEWKDVPSSNLPANPQVTLTANVNRADPWLTALWQQHLSQPDGGQIHAAEPITVSDDELIEQRDNDVTQLSVSSASEDIQRLDLRILPEVSAVPKSDSYEDFAVLVHLKAPVGGSSVPRAPVDLVTVLDVSGSMAGTKLALLKRAMGFVIQHLSSEDRLSVVAFSSTARRLFHLRRMTSIGKHQALQAVNSLSSGGGTNIAEGLKMGAQVMLDRRCNNPVSSIILLSDGQDTYTITGSTGAESQTDYRLLLPSSIQQTPDTNSQIPVYTFGFGADHDPVLMHAISEGSGGTFSFIQTESAIQDAFAQCIGGLLSVVVQELKVFVQCLDTTRLSSIKSGSYQARVGVDARAGSIDVGRLYAEEERDFLVLVDFPAASSNQMPLLKVGYTYTDTITKESKSFDGIEVEIDRPEATGPHEVSIEVDRQRNRLGAADAMSEAKAAAERGDLAGAVSILEKCRQDLSESASMRARDPLSMELCRELTEMKERMSNRQLYEATGRAYVLSGLSSHSWQRATGRGDSTNSSSVSQVYQTTQMTEMISRSQTMVFGNPAVLTPPISPPPSFTGPPRPR